MAALIGVALLATPVTAQRLVADVHPPDPRAPRVVDAYGSSPVEYVQVGDRLWFVGYARSLGRQPFISDGTEAGTRIVPGLGATQLVAIENLDDRRAILFGDGIWVSDGTLGGTQRVAAIEFARESGTRRYRARVGNRVYFHGFTPERGWEPWITDGTVAGTRMLRDGLPGPQPAEPYAHVLGTLRGGLYLPGLDPASGLELWSTDGTPEGTQLVRDLNPGVADSIVRDETRFLAAEDRAFFSARVDPYGIEPCVTDGTAAGTFLLADTHRGSASGVAWSTYAPAIAAGKLFFAAETAAAGIEPWVSDGTTAGTFLLADLAQGVESSQPYGFQRVASGVTFAAVHQVWVTDGTRGNVQSLQRSSEERFNLQYLVPLVGAARPERMFFVAYEPVHGRELWSTDGTGDGTRLVFDGTPGSAGSPAIAQIHAVGDRYVFFFDNRQHGIEPWSTAWTAIGASMLADIWPGHVGGIDPKYLATISFRGELVFNASDPTHGCEPWITDGSRQGSRLFADAVPTRPVSSHPEWIGTLRDRALFHALDAAHGVEPWITDGSTRGTRMLKELWPGPGPIGAARSFSAEVNDRVVFSAVEPATGMELWTSDGTTEGTRLLLDLCPGSVGSDPWLSLVAGRRLLFFADDGVHGREPWITDGSAGGTWMLKDIAAGIRSSVNGVVSLVGTPPRILFVADDRIHGAEPWITDGTPEGTRLLLDVLPGPAGSCHDVRTALLSDGSVVFSAQDGVGPGVWITNGTAAGTRLVSPAMRRSEFAAFVLQSCGTTLPGRFVASELLSRESWLSDGTAVGTTPLGGGVFSVASAMSPDRLLILGLGALWTLDASAQRKLVLSFSQQGVQVEIAFVTSGRLAFFRATDAAHGSELWVTDGTTAGTRLVLDLEPGSPGSAPAEPWIVAAGDNGRVFFNARDRAHGEEMWVSDGTAAGTRLVGDLYPGVLSSDPKPFARVGEQWLFIAESPEVGRELFAVDLRDVGAAIARPFGAGCDGSGARAPLLDARGAPVLAATGFAAELRHARPLAPAVLLIGRGPEPSFFAGGCSLYLEPLPADLRTVITDALGEARVPLQVPADPQLVGLLLHAQALVLDPHGAWLGLLAFSNGLELVVGR